MCMPTSLTGGIIANTTADCNDNYKSDKWRTSDRAARVSIIISPPSENNFLTDSNIALLIDYENVGIDSMQGLVEQLSGMGRIIVKRAYADWSSQRKGQERLIELGVEAVHNYRGTRAGKNSCDIKLTIDAVELLHSAQVDTFVIVSSDSDFVPLVNHLRGSGKSVIGAGRKAVTSTTMVKSCDRYIFLGTETSSPAPYRSAEHKRNGRTTRRPLESAGSESSSINNRGSDSVSVLLARAVEATMDDEGNALGTRLAQTMTRIDPSFSYRDLGHRSFREFLLSRGEINVALREGTDFTVSLNGAETSPKPASEIDKRIPRAPQVSPRIIESSSDRPTHRSSAQSSETKSMRKEPESIPGDWEKRVHSAWEQKEKESISGQSAASEAAKVLGFQRLRDSVFPTLDKLLGASKFLKSNWSRNKNFVIKNK